MIAVPFLSVGLNICVIDGGRMTVSSPCLCQRKLGVFLFVCQDQDQNVSPFSELIWVNFKVAYWFCYTFSWWMCHRCRFCQ
jgi:hypothetical protein